MSDLSIDREALRRGKYTAKYADLTAEQLHGLLWLLGEWSSRATPEGDYAGSASRAFAARTALLDFHRHPLTSAQVRSLMQASQLDESAADLVRRFAAVMSAPVVVWRYTVPAEPWRRLARDPEHRYSGLGYFLIDSSGMFTCVTDYGNYAYKWSDWGPRDFRSFLCGLSSDYLCGKLDSTRGIQVRTLAERLYPRLVALLKIDLAQPPTKCGR
jgi:hypothetical protein